MRHLYKYFLCMLLLLAPLNNAFSGMPEIGERLPIINNSSKHSIINSKQLTFRVNNNSDLLNSARSVLSDLDAHVDNKRRGAKEASIYAKAVNSVVRIISKNKDDKFFGGSGSVISDSGDILTNWHVIEDSLDIAILFSPKTDSTKEDNVIYGAEIIHINKKKDLALLRLKILPNYLPILKISSDMPLVGMDTHAIGHPEGGANWSYTRGIVSQIRNDYVWRGSAENEHMSSVIQTQTPINPGNSGGPLLNDDGEIIGVNSFQMIKSQNINYAVANTSLLRFLEEPRINITKEEKKLACEPTEELSSKYDKEDKLTFTTYDTDCNGSIDVAVYTHDNGNKLVEIDSNGDGLSDKMIYDIDADSKWDYSHHDTDHDGEVDLVGLHPDGDINASSFKEFKG